jgi:hypothetical protein
MRERLSALQCGLRRGSTLGRDLEQSLGLAAPFGGGFTQPGPDKALVLQAVQGDIDGTARDRASGARLELGAHRNGIAGLALPHHGQQDQQFEFTQAGRCAHAPAFAARVAASHPAAGISSSAAAAAHIG